MRLDVLKVAMVGAALLAPVAGASGQATSPCTTGKIALVNSQAILASIPEYVQAESLLAKEADGFRAELAKHQAAFDSARVAYSDKLTLLTASQKTAEVRKLQDQNDALQKHAADLDAKMNQRTSEVMSPIQTRVQAVLDGMRAELNCSVIFDVSSGNGIGIASADPALNLTDRVIERLKGSSTPAKPPAKAPGTGGIKPPGGGGGDDLLPAATPAVL